MKLLTHFGNSANYKASWTISVHHPRSRGGRIDTESVWVTLRTIRCWNIQYDVSIRFKYRFAIKYHETFRYFNFHFSKADTDTRIRRKKSDRDHVAPINSYLRKMSDRYLGEQFYSFRVFISSIYISKFIYRYRPRLSTRHLYEFARALIPYISINSVRDRGSLMRQQLYIFIWSVNWLMAMIER